MQSDWVKLAIVFLLYGLIAPIAGLFLRNRRHWQRLAFACLCFMTIGGLFHASEWGLTLSNHLYRGHARGYHFYFAELFAIALIIARFSEDWRRFRWLPPGLVFYFAYCILSLVSIFNAPAPSFTLMAAFKAFKASLVLIAACNFFECEEDIHFFLRAMTATMIWECVIVLKMKYADHIYQVPGTFEHQNSLSMFATMIGLVLLAASLGPKHRSSNQYLLGYVVCSIVQQATLSRAGLAVYAAGTMAVSVLSLAEKMTRRRIWVLASLTAVAITGLALSMNTIVGRFHDAGNEASEKTRALLNEASRRMLRDYPLGIGWNNFALVINKPFPYGRVIDDWERAGGATVDETAPKGVVESHYYLLLAETGYQSLIGYVFFILVFLWRNIRATFSYRYHFLGAVSLGTGLGCLSNYAQSMLERVLTQPRNLMLWIILLGLTAKIEIWRRSAPRKRQESAATKIRSSPHLLAKAHR